MIEGKPRISEHEGDGCPLDMRPSPPASNSSAQARAAAIEAAEAAIKALDTLDNLDSVVTTGIKELVGMLTFSGRTTHAEIALSNPVANFVGRPVECWKEHGWALIPPTVATRKIAAQFEEMVEQKKLYTTTPQTLKNKVQSIIAGSVVQSVLAQTDPVVVAVREVALAAAKVVAPAFFKAPPRTKKKQEKAEVSWVGSSKSLVSSKGAGMQPIHWDSPRWQGDDEKECAISVLFYGLDCDTTLVSAFSADRFTPEMDQQLMMARAPLLDKRLFCSASVKAGTMLLFRHSVPHAGVTCTADRRIVLFGMLTREPKGLAAEDQYFEWNYIRDAFGARSSEYEARLNKNIQLGHEPLQRESLKEQKALQEWLEQEKLEEEKKKKEQEEEEK